MEIYSERRGLVQKLVEYGGSILRVDTCLLVKLQGSAISRYCYHYCFLSAVIYVVSRRASKCRTLLLL